MNTKPTYQELEHRVKELEKKSFQHQQTEEALKRITDEQAVLLSAVPAMIFWIDKEGNFIRVNEPFAAALKKSPDEINGKSLFDLYPEDQATKYHSDNLEVIESDKPKKNVEERVQTPAGTMWVFTDKIPYSDKEGNNVGIIGFSVDITDLKRAEEALRESEEIYRSLSNNIPGMVYRGRPDWSTEVISNSEDICGHSAEEFNSQKINWLDIIHPDDKERVLDETVELEKKHMNIVQEYRIINKGGSIRWVEDHKSSRFKKEGIFQGVDGVVFDITEHKQTEEERRKLEAQLHQALKMEAIGTLAGGIAHDFNNVLMGIQGHMSLALLYADSGRPHSEHLKGIEDMVKRGADLTKQLLGFARGGKYEVKPTDLSKLIENSSEMFGRTKKEIKIHRKHQKDIWPVEVDRGQIDQVLLNLYINAWQAMPRGGHLYIETSNVVLDENYTKPFGVKPGNYVKTSVTDTGIGIDEATQQRIFDPFFTTKEMGRGTGLGLASAYGIIKSHGGIINIDSEKGKGTTFNIYLPASEKEVTIEEKKLADEILKGTETVLFVDDEDMILAVGEEMLKEMGYKVLMARTGKEAVEIYRKHKDEIDLVILDMIMPEMGGGEAYDRIKENNPKVKALLASGYSIDGQATEILGRGCDGFIQKPFNVKELSRKIREILDKK